MSVRTVVTFESGRVSPRSAPLGGRLLSPARRGRSGPLDYFAAGDLAGRRFARETLHRDAPRSGSANRRPACPAGDFSARMTAPFTPDVSGPWTLSVSGVGTARLFLDGELLADTVGAPTGAGILGLFTIPIECRGRPHRRGHLRGGGRVRCRAGRGPDRARRPDRRGPPARSTRRRRAGGAAAAADADVAHRRRRPGRPRDRGQDAASMDLPADQVELIRRVAAANPRTVVVVNTASPVTMDWADDVAAVVQMSYLGQETGAALAAVLFGDADASGRLTTTHPRRVEDCPAHRNFPGAGRHGRVRRGTVRRVPPLRHATGSNRAGASGTASRTRPSPTRRSPSRAAVHRSTIATAWPGVGRRHEHRRPRRDARWSRCTCEASTPRCRGRTVSSRRSRRSRSSPARRPPSPSSSTARVRLLGPGPSCWRVAAGRLRDPGRIVVPGDPPDGRVVADGQAHTSHSGVSARL